MATGQDTSQELRELAVDFFTAIGSLVECRDDGLVDVVLPEGHQGWVDGAGFVQLTFDQEVAALHHEAHYVTLGSELATHLANTASNLGLATRWYVNGLKWSQRRAIELDKWKARLANARFTSDGVEFPFACHCVLFNFRISYISDDKREEIHTVIVDSHSLQPALKLEHHWGRIPLGTRREFYASGHDTLPTADRLTLVYQQATRILEGRITDTISTYQRRTARHLELENLRINAFYDDTEAELRRRMERAETEEGRRAVERKIEATHLERERKLADIAEKHRLRVVFTLLNGAIIIQPKVRTNLRLDNKYATANLEVVFDPLGGDIELPSCQVCHKAASTMHLCSNGHIVCEGCILTCSACKREYCCSCGMRACCTCGRTLCEHHQVLCAECGRITCWDHRCRCH